MFTKAIRPKTQFVVALLAVSLSVSCSMNRRSYQSDVEKTMSGPRNLVVHNALVWTGVEEDTAVNEIRSIAVVDGKIAAVGSREEVACHVTNGASVIDAKGCRALPGITDSHLHLIGGGLGLSRINLRAAVDKSAFVRMVGEAAKSKRPGQWVLGGRWSVESWDNPEEPHRAWIDPVTQDVPVFLTRMDGHGGLANSAALKLAGIDASGPVDPEGGEIQRDPQTGEPTGILKEGAMELVRAHIPRLSKDDLRDGLFAAMRYANEHGITAVHHMCEPEELEVLAEASRAGEMTLRVHAYLSVTDWPRNVNEVRRFADCGEMFAVHGFKGFMDGSLGSRNAYMCEPYADAEEHWRYPRGQLTDFADPPEAFKELVVMADRERLQCAIHAIGDCANQILLDAYVKANTENGRRDARHRIEHAQHLRLSDIERFAKQGVVASMQPYHKADDGRYAEKAIGRERLAGSYAFRQLKDRGVLLVFGSDWPVVTIDPFAGIDSAVNAKTLDGKVWLKEHSLSVEEAIFAYTVAPHAAVHREATIGTIEPGMLADLVILDIDPFRCDKDELPNIKPTHTIVGGRVVYEKD